MTDAAHNSDVPDATGGVTNSLLEQGWKKLFSRHDIERRVANQGFVDLHSSDFHLGRNEKLEIRLHTKMDSSDVVPTVMRKLKLNLLTISNSCWRVGTFDPFMKLPAWMGANEHIIPVNLPYQLQSLDMKNVTSEGQVISLLLLSGALEHFCGEKLVQTISGRSKASDFSFSIRDSLTGRPIGFEVGGFQFEIDAGFEGEDAIYLIEAKNRDLADFNLRQLYYPYRVWRTRVSKPVRLLFVNHIGGVFDVIEYSFDQVDDFSSVRQIRHERYALDPSKVTAEDVRIVAANSYHVEVNDHVAPFPQADRFGRVVNLLDKLAVEPLNSVQIADIYEFDIRQADYYGNAALYLGLVTFDKAGRESRVWKLSSEGERFLRLDARSRNLLLVELVLNMRPVAQLYAEMASGREVTKGSAKALVGGLPEVQFQPGDERKKYSDRVIDRRIRTALSWAKWVHDFTN